MAAATVREPTMSTLLLERLSASGVFGRTPTALSSAPIVCRKRSSRSIRSPDSVKTKAAAAPCQDRHGEDDQALRRRTDSSDGRSGAPGSMS